MAGVKVTDLTTTSTAAATDVFYIVDTGSDTSKQIEVQNIYSGMPQFDSGTFTPTISNELNCAVTCLRALYSRVDNVVTCSYYIDFDLDPTFTLGNFNISLPVASDFTNERNAFGVITPITNAYTELIRNYISADSILNQITFQIELSAADAQLTFVANIQYIIL